MSRRRAQHLPIALLPLLLLLSACVAPARAPESPITLTIVGTNDVHGALLPSDGQGGFVTVSGYVDALRAARAADGGAVLFIDAGDMWQGTLESNLVEGAAVLKAYNAAGVAAAAVGNHEFDFGPLGDKAIPADNNDDPRGALRARAREATFPLLAANLIDDATGEPVAWENVQPSALVDTAGIRVGIIGVMSENALVTTIAANTTGLSLAPLAATIEREARSLRQRGATVVIVAAHAGAHCREFADPFDLSSCRAGGELLRVAAALPPGLVDHIIGGHVHQGVAHIVNGISLTASYSSTRAFSRVDLSVERGSGRVIDRRVYPPQPATATAATRYEGQPVIPNPAVLAIAEAAAANAAARKAERLGVTLAAPFPVVPDVESAISNLVTEAVLDEIGADIALHNVFGGIRKGLPEGELTFGDVYEMFPFDNIVTVLDLSGRELREVIARQVPRRPRLAGFAGMRVFVECEGAVMDVVMLRTDGTEIDDEDRVRVAANDFLALGGDDILTPVIPAEGFRLRDDMPRTRDVLIDWFRGNAGTLRPEAYVSNAAPKWNLPDIIPAECQL
ncbi:MAG TPA: 5'-nucleotidase C-terminal domain-containing protein [Woeseiaceae bacterium]